MSDLIARLEKATGPDIKLDAEIYAAIVASGQYNITPLSFTASIDAALMLVPEGWFARLATGGRRPDGQKTKADADLGEPIETQFGSGIGVRAQAEAHTVALALCIAAMKARAGKP